MEPQTQSSFSSLQKLTKSDFEKRIIDARYLEAKTLDSVNVLNKFTLRSRQSKYYPKKLPSPLEYLDAERVVSVYHNRSQQHKFRDFLSEESTTNVHVFLDLTKYHNFGREQEKSSSVYPFSYRFLWQKQAGL